MIRPLVGLTLWAFVLLAAPPSRAENSLGNCKYYTKTQQDFEQGLPYCEKCILEEPENPEAHYFGAWCLAEVGRYEDAWTSFSWLMERANVKDKSTRKHAKWAAERVQAYFARHFNKGVEYLNANDLPAAREEFLQATQINPVKPEGYLNLGYVQNQLGDADGALTSFRKAIEIAPDRKESYEYYSLALGRKRDALMGEVRPDTLAIAETTAELKKTLEQVVVNEPTNDAALLQLGDIALAQGDEETGIAHIEKAISIAPENVVKLYNLAVGFYQRSQFPKAARTFGLVADHVDDPEDDLWRDAMYNRGLALKESGEFDEALVCAKRLLEVDETEPDYHGLARDIYVGLKDLQSASVHADRAEELKSEAIEGSVEEAP
jgi:tetratricopeptide (TPR) repeat protein